jgi:ADP-heptose:LPS heptosyltransferase
MTSAPDRKVLVMRLSSLGDVILSTSVLKTNLGQKGVDYLVADSYEDLLVDHPQVKRLWSYTRSDGLKGWNQMLRDIWDEKYELIFDLHDSLRTNWARLLFL